MGMDQMTMMTKVEKFKKHDDDEASEYMTLKSQNKEGKKKKNWVKNAPPKKVTIKKELHEKVSYQFINIYGHTYLSNYLEAKACS